MTNPAPAASARAVAPVWAVDLMANGTFRPVTEPWPEPAAPADASWRWLHFDVADPGLKTWERQMLPRTAGNALLKLQLLDYIIQVCIIKICLYIFQGKTQPVVGKQRLIKCQD